MKRTRRVGIIILLVVVLVAGFLLPTIVARIQDSQANQTRRAVRANSVQLEMSSTLTVLQKLRTVAEEPSAVEVESAPNMDEEQAYDILTQGLRRLFGGNFAGVSLSVNGFSEVNHQIILKMSGADSLIYWEFWLADADGNQITVALDDEAGIILSLRYTFSQGVEEEESEEQQALPRLPLYFQQDVPTDTAATISSQGIIAELEENGSSAEDFLAAFADRYCGPYLLTKDVHIGWQTDSAEPAEASYQYSVMTVDDEGGYYVLPFTLSNNEIAMN